MTTLCTVPAVVVALLSIGGICAAGPAPEAEAARDLARRVLPHHYDRVSFEVIPAAEGRDVFELSGRAGRVVVRGNSALSMAFGLNWYLKYRAHAHVSLNGAQVDLRNGLPPVGEDFRLEGWARYRYLINYVTFGYVSPWWDWDQWERFIDWMALNGINTPLAVTGQEAVWQAVCRRLGMSDEEIAAFLPGPPYLPFCWMGCLDGFGGPLPRDWVPRHVDLQQRILQRERELGMTPVLQGFTGHIPEAIAQRYAKAQVQRIHWIEFDTCMLDPRDPLFSRIARLFIEEQTHLFGTDHLYAADSFIEMTPPSGDLDYLAGIGRAIYEGMARTDPEAVWLLQGWTFMNQQAFWTQDRIKAFLGAVPDDRMLVLDLFCDVNPVWDKTEGFYGKPWVWSFVYNFGGQVVLGAGGPLDRFGDLARAREHPLGRNLSGVGLMMEGYGHNPLVFDLMFELAWRDSVDLDAWLRDYAVFRYGVASEDAQAAWEILRERVYSRGTGGQTAVTCFPSEQCVYAAHPLQALADAWLRLLDAEEALGHSETYEHDLVNIARQALAAYGGILYQDVMAAYRRGDAPAHREASEAFIALICDLDQLVGANEGFLLGNWIRDARRWGRSEAERDRLEYNARRILTLWGKSPALRDYAAKEWSGLLSGFYAKRWELFLARQQEALESGREFDSAACQAELLAFENHWADQHESYPSRPHGDAVEIARRLHGRYMTGLPSVRSLATGKPATCSHSLPGMDAALANDGWVETGGYWGMDVGSQGPDSWWQVDLEQETTVGRVVVVGYYGDARYYGFTVEVSRDGVTFETVADRRDNRDPATREGYVCAFEPRPARFTRVTMTGNSANSGRHLVEVMAYAQ